MTQKPVLLRILIAALFAQSIIGVARASLAPVGLVRIELVNKLTAKKTTIDIPPATSLRVHDIRIQPGVCVREEDPLRGSVWRAQMQVFLEQENQDSLEIYQGELSSNPASPPKKPLEHPIYGIRLIQCE